MPKTKLAKVSLTPKGAWDATTAYEQLDLVSYDGGSWVAKKPSTGVPPRENDCWMQAAEKGEKGAKGDTGALTKPGASYSTIDYFNAAFCQYTHGNILAFLDPAQIIVEKTTDGGVTWEDAEISDDNKRLLFHPERMDVGINIPTIDGVISKLCGIRVTISPNLYNVPEGTAETDKINYWTSEYYKKTVEYGAINGLFIWSRAANQNIAFTLDTATYSNPSAWTLRISTRLSGDSGLTFLPVQNLLFGGYTSMSGHLAIWRMTFMSYADGTEKTTRPNAIGSINATSNGLSHIITNNYQRCGTVYSVDEMQNATFPAKLYSNGGYEIYDEKPFKLIETITFDEAAALLRTAKPDGTPYNFREVVVKLTSKSGAATQSLAPICFMYNAYYAGYAHYGAFSTATTYSIVHCYPKNGYWWTIRNYPGSTDSFSYSTHCLSGDGYTLTKSLSQYPCINKIISTAAIVAGTEIEIWAVEA